MKLPFLKRQHTPTREYFLSLLVRATSLVAILFEEEQKNLSIITSSEEEFKQGMEFASADDLTSLSDKVISTVETSLPEGGEVSKTIFAVPSTWVEEGKIKRDYLLKLKKVCDTLALVPIGFIISVEAIIAYLQQKQGAPLTSLFVELAGTTVHVYLVKAGNIVEKKSGEVEASVVKTVEQLLGEFDVEVFPSKIVLFDHSGAQKTAHEFLSHKWPEELPFLHLPKTEALDKDFENEAIVHGVASQMGFDVLEKEASEVQKLPEEVEDIQGIDLGFVKDQDIAEVSADREAAEAEHMIPHMKRDEHENLAPVEPESEREEPVHHAIPKKAAIEETLPEEEKESPGEKRNILAGFFSLFRMIKIPSLPLPKIVKGPGIGAIIILVILLLAGGAYFYYADLERAEINITTSTKSIQKDVDVTFQQHASTSTSDNVVALNTVSVDVDGQDSAPASGKTDTGDKAKGSVTIYNKTDSSKTFSKGTTITGPNSLKFDLTDDVTVASTSAFATDISSSNVNVVADKFGQEYNLPSSSNFTIAGSSSSDYFAKNGAAFSGGSKKSVTSVSADDMNSLLSKVEDEMKSKAIQQAQSQAGGDKGIIATPLDTTITQKKFDHKAGDQASTINLTASATYSFGTYQKSDVATIVGNASKSDVPQGFSLSLNKSSFDVKNITVDKDGTVKATVSSQAVYEPHLDTSFFGKQYSGKSADSVQRSLSSVDGIADISVTLKNSLPFMPKLLPFSASHISVVTQSQ